MFKAACIQLCSTMDVGANIKQADTLIRQAHGEGAQLIATPECTGQCGEDEEMCTAAYEEAEHPVLLAMRALAATLKVELLIGSLAVKATGDKLYNRSYYLNRQGEVAAHYDKIMLFDVTIPDGRSYQESKRYEAGAKLVSHKSELATMGMTICYDLRHPGIYRTISQAGAEVLLVPAAFTKRTGELEHWKTLLRARAIENSAYVIAPNQVGSHNENRHSYGHSLIIDPWGQVLAEAEGGSPSVILAEIDPAKVLDVRTRIPAWGMNPDFSI